MTALADSRAGADVAPATGVRDLGRVRSLRRVVGIGVVAVAAAVVLSLTIGSRTLAPGEVWAALTGATGVPADVAGIVDARLDRTLIGLVVGAGVALSGAVLQGLTRNPLADPGILGLNSGAALAVVLGIRFVGLTTVGAYVWFALIGVLVAAVLVQAISLLAPERSRPLTMALAGAAIMAAVTSILGGMLVTSREALEVFRFWQVGSIAGRDASIVAEVAPILVVGLLLTLTSPSVLNATALGDDLARGLGQRVLLHRGAAGLGAVLLCAASTALAGPIGFVGLVVPHVLRLLAGPDYRRILVGCLLLGPALVLATDVVGRIVSQPSEVQVGIMSAVLGAPMLILLVRRMGAR